MKRIKSFGIFQTAKVAGIIYFLLSIVILVPIWGIMSLLPQDRLGFPFAGAMMILLPFIYGFVGFITTAIGCMIYNLIAQWTGGIEVEVETIGTGTVQ